MNLRSAFLAIVATTALAGAALTTTPAQAAPCIFSQQGGLSDGAPSSPAIDPNTTQANSGGFNHLTKLGAGAAILGGLFLGGMVLKRRADRPTEPVVPAAHETASQPHDLLESAFAAPEFAIEVPKEALQSAQDAEDAELTTVR